MSALTSLLVRDDAVSVRQIEDALQRQIMDGGELDTALLELGALPENVLIAYRAASEHGLPAGRDEVMGASSATRVLLPADKALALRVTPLVHDATSLTVASCRPLSVAELAELADSTGLRIEQRITSELRVAAALERFYGVPMSARLATLLARVESLSPGEMRIVEPLLEPTNVEHAEPMPDFEESEDFEAALSAAFERASGAPTSNPPPPRASDPTEAGPTRPLSGSKGKRRGSLPASAKPQPKAAQDASLRPSARPAPVPPQPSAAAIVSAPAPRPTAATAPARRAPVRLPQGPLTAALAEEALNAAEERDAVMEICFRFARQYFDTTVVLNIKDERLVGAMAHNASALVDVREVSVPILRGGSIDDLMRSLLPRVADLGRKDEDRVLALSLKRLAAQPAALVPICIKRRVVSVLYGDRGGDNLYVDELSDLLGLMPHVARAFERIIRTRKALGLANTGTPAAFRDLSHAPTQRSIAMPQLPKLGEEPDTAVVDARTQRALEALGVARPAPQPPAPRPAADPMFSRAPRSAADPVHSRAPGSPRTAADPRPHRGAAEAGPPHTGADPMFSRTPRGAAEPDTSRTAEPTYARASREPAVPAASAHFEPTIARGSRAAEPRSPVEPPTARTSRLPAAPQVTEPEEHDSDIYATARIPIQPLPLDQFESAPRYLSKPPPGTGRYQSLHPGASLAVDDLTGADKPRERESAESSQRTAAEPAARQDREDDTQRIRNQRKTGRPRYGRSQPPRARTSAPPPAPPPGVGRASLHVSKPAPGTGAYHSPGLTTEMISIPQARVPDVSHGAAAETASAHGSQALAVPAPQPTAAGNAVVSRVATQPMGADLQRTAANDASHVASAVANDVTHAQAAPAQRGDAGHASSQAGAGITQPGASARDAGSSAYTGPGRAGTAASREGQRTGAAQAHAQGGAGGLQSTAAEASYAGGEPQGAAHTGARERQPTAAEASYAGGEPQGAAHTGARAPQPTAAEISRAGGQSHGTSPLAAADTRTAGQPGPAAALPAAADVQSRGSAARTNDASLAGAGVPQPTAASRHGADLHAARDPARPQPAAAGHDAHAEDDSIPITIAPPAASADELGPRMAALLARKVDEDASAEVQAVHALGEPALSALLARFPGPLWFDRRRPHVRVPFGRDIGPVARALETFGEQALARFAPLLRVPDVEGRYYATLFACDRVHPALLEPLLERLFDEDAQIRLLVRDVLPHYRRLPGFEPVAERLCAQALAAEAPLRSRLAAIDAIGVLRDAASVPTLIELSAHTDKQISVPALRALTAITCQDFAKNTKKWRAWYESNAYRHRVEWLIEGLMHSDQNLRAAAGLELQKLTQVYYGYVAAASKRERELAQKRYWDWWRTEGRRKF